VGVLRSHEALEQLAGIVLRRLSRSYVKTPLSKDAASTVLRLRFFIVSSMMSGRIEALLVRHRRRGRMSHKLYHRCPAFIVTK
jgi:hypothetical protein